MGTLSFPGLVTSQITTSTISQASFPTTPSVPPRATASFGAGGNSFLLRSNRQEVTASDAVIGVGVSIVGVNFDGPVSLRFADTGVDVNDLHIVDEGGFCSLSKKITVISDAGTTEIKNPYSSMRLRIREGKSIPEAIAPVVVGEDGSQIIENPDGSTTETDALGNSTTTLVDGNTTTTVKVLVDGTTVNIVAESDGSSATYTVLPDGTTIDAAESRNGNVKSTTSYPDGSTVEADLRASGRESTFTTLADGTTIDVLETSNGNTSKVTVSPEGNVLTEISRTNGRTSSSSVNVDGSSSSSTLYSNGKVVNITIDVGGTTIKELYLPWKSFYTVTTTPPGTSETFSPNPYL